MNKTVKTNKKNFCSLISNLCTTLFMPKQKNKKKNQQNYIQTQKTQKNSKITKQKKYQNKIKLIEFFF